MHGVRRTLLAAVGAGVLSLLAAGSAQALSVESESVSHITGSDATVEAMVNTEGLPNGAFFQFQVVPSPGEFFDELACNKRNSSLCLGVGVHAGALAIQFVKGELAAHNVQLDLNKGGGITGVPMTLSPGTTYQYRVIAEASKPAEDVFVVIPPLVVGPEQTFRTLAPPIVATDGATATGPRSARVEGNADPEGQETTLHADYALASEAWCTSGGAEGTPLESASQNLGSGDAMISEIGVPLAELMPESEYCAELVASNGTGTSHGSRVSFTTPAEIEHLTFSGLSVSGSITPMDSRQAITLPAGSMFNGSGELNVMTGEGGVSGNLAIPPFSTSLKRLGITLKPVGLTISEVGPLTGTLAPSSAVAGDETLTIPAKLQLDLTKLGIFGLTVPTTCATSGPLSFTLTDTLTREELRAGSWTFKGMTLVPKVKCSGGFLGQFVAPILAGLLSGPATYSIAIKAP